MDYMIWDMQFGSTGKGLLAGYLAKKIAPDGVVSAWAPNAGHTFVDEEGYATIRTMLPIGTVANPKYVFLGPGSVINIESLTLELEEARSRGWEGSLIIHETAAVVQPKHRELEKVFNVIGSTQKGSAEAVIEKMRRPIKHAPIAREYIDMLSRLGAGVVKSRVYHSMMASCKVMQVEAAQGHSLSIDHGFYPYVTSRDTSPLRVLADCGWPLTRGMPLVYGTARTYPIRVANRFDENSKMVGWSGPAYSDQKEITWESIGQKAELTTVTKLPRRIFTFSMEQMVQAAEVGNPVAVFLNFCNYVQDDATLVRLTAAIEQLDVRVAWLGHGPKESDVTERGS